MSSLCHYLYNVSLRRNFTECVFNGSVKKLRCECWVLEPLNVSPPLLDTRNLQTTEVVVGMIIFFYGTWLGQASKMLSADSVVGIAIPNLAIKLFTT